MAGLRSAAPATRVAGRGTADVRDRAGRREEIGHLLQPAGRSSRGAVRSLAAAVGQVLERRRRHADRYARIARIGAHRSDVPVEDRRAVVGVALDRRNAPERVDVRPAPGVEYRGVRRGPDRAGLDVGCPVGDLVVAECWLLTLFMRVVTWCIADYAGSTAFQVRSQVVELAVPAPLS
jgi:hypothetical protein